MLRNNGAKLWILGMKTENIHNSTATLAGLNERNFNQRPVSLWFRETQGTQTRDSKDSAWVYLCR